MGYGTPPAIRLCTRSDHPIRRHGHYGYGGRYWCCDFNSSLLSEDNMGHIERGWIVIFEGPEICKCNPAEVEQGVCILCGKPFPVGGAV